MRPVLFGIFVVFATALVWFGYGARAAYFERYYAVVGMCVGLEELANRLSKDDLQLLSNATGCFFLERTSGEIWALDKASRLFNRVRISALPAPFVTKSETPRALALARSSSVSSPETRMNGNC